MYNRATSVRTLSGAHTSAFAVMSITAVIITSSNCICFCLSRVIFILFFWGGGYVLFWVRRSALVPRLWLSFVVMI